MSQQCPTCSKPVYFAEECKAIGKTFHKLCLKCNQCNKQLDSTSLNDHEGDIFCRSCYNKLHGPRGYGFASGGAGLSTDAKGHTVKMQEPVVMHSTAVPGDICPRCNTRVYFAEEMRAQGKKYHKRCLVCMDCKKLLDSTTLTTHDEDIYCKSCYGKKFGPRGYGFAGGKAMLSSETGTDNMSSLAKAQAVSGTTNGTAPKTDDPECCPRCNKRVYFAEEKRAMNRKYHKLCLCCTECKKLLDSTNLTTHGEDIFCKACYGKKFGPRGYGFAGGSSGLSMDTGRPGEVTTDNVSSLAKAQAVSGTTNGTAPKTDDPECCPRCNKRVYFAEEKRAMNRKYHKLCLCCTECKKLLDSTNLTTHGDDIFCKACYGKKFGPRGYGFAGGSSGLSMDTGRPGEVTTENVSSYAKAQVVTGGTGDGGSRFGGADVCPRCGNNVYMAEKVIGGGKSWHKMCFRCEDCNKALESTTLCEAGDKIVCKSCYSKTYGPKGFGFGALNTTE